MLGLIPQPRECDVRPGVVVWTGLVGVVAPDEWRDAIDTWCVESSIEGCAVTITSTVDAPRLTIRRDSSLPSGGYRLVTDDVSEIMASDASGALHALATLRQLGPLEWWRGGDVNGGRIEISKVQIADWPEFGWRGAHLDVARHFFPVDVVENFIDLIAAHKLNSLHLHLNDDQGWRVELPQWPRLTEVGAWRRASPIGLERDGVDDGTPHGGFYRADDIARLVGHATRRGVRLIPEIDLPGHAQAVLASYPDLGNGGGPVEVWTHWGISREVLAPSTEALEFAASVVRAVADMFPGSPVHIGGDECPTDQWELSDDARAVMVEHGFTEVRELQGLFTRRLTEELTVAGRDVVAWDEVLDADSPTSVIVAAWRSVDKGREAAIRGHRVVMAPMPFTYFDWRQSDDPLEPLAMAFPLAMSTWEKVYGFTVVPDGLDDEAASRILGAQAQHWTEYIATSEHLEYMAFPRLAAFAEVVWGTAGTVEQFRPRLETHVARLRANGVNFRPLDGPAS